MTIEPGFTALFDGTTLTGWSAIPRSYGRLYPDGPQVLDVFTVFPPDYQERADAFPAAWSVEDGEIVGRQQPAGSGYGGYLITAGPGPSEASTATASAASTLFRSRSMWIATRMANQSVCDLTTLRRALSHFIRRNGRC